MPCPHSNTDAVLPGELAGATGAPGSRCCTLKIRFELGKKMPRINCARFPVGGSGGGFNLNWDGAWEVRTATTDQGWTAEFEIPFRTLRE